MREHIGIDVDALDDEDARTHNTAEGEHVTHIWDPNAEQKCGQGSFTEKLHHAERVKVVVRDVVQQGDI